VFGAVRSGYNKFIRDAVFIGGILLSCTAALADGPPTTDNPPRFEAWTGADAFQRHWSVYAGAAYAPFGSVREDGVRLRAVTGYGAFAYTSPRWSGTSVQTLDFHGTVSFADFLIGYHKQMGPLTIKVLGGITVADHVVDDPESPMRGVAWGGKGVLETWWNMTDQAWSSVDLSWTTLQNVYGARARLGWRVWPAFSIGVEGGASGTWDYDTARFGGFVRYEWSAGELSVSGGLSSDGPRSGWTDTQGSFATANALFRF
jgi:cellulose biosynthesis protein BcsS